MIGMVGPIERVDDYISDPAYPIEENNTIKKAIKLMEEKDTDFLVVTREDIPVYILKKYQALGEDPNAKIAIVASEGKLDPAVVVESGSPWSDARNRLRDTTILVVADTYTKVPQIRGTISAYNIKFKKRAL